MTVPSNMIKLNHGIYYCHDYAGFERAIREFVGIEDPRVFPQPTQFPNVVFLKMHLGNISVREVPAERLKEVLATV